MLSKLPLELIYNIIENLNDDSNRMAYPTRHPDTQLLLSFCLVNKACNRIATKRLYSRCTFIQTFHHAKFLSRALDENLALAYNITSLVISFPKLEDNLYACNGNDLCCTTGQLLHHLILILTHTKHSLRRLLMHLPLRFNHRSCFANLADTFDTTCENLEAVEELVLITGSRISMEYVDHAMYKDWQHLRRLVLRSTNLGDGMSYSTSFTTQLRHRDNLLRTLEQLVLVEPYGGVLHSEWVFSNFIQENRSPLSKIVLVQHEQHELMRCHMQARHEVEIREQRAIKLVNTDEGVNGTLLGTTSKCWESPTVYLVSIPTNELAYDLDTAEADVTGWASEKAIDGSIWACAEFFSDSWRIEL